MSETITILEQGNKEAQYLHLLPQIASLVSGESDQIANFANVSAVLKTAFNFFWVGFYRVVQQDLVLGPFQGPIACTRIAYGKGVCGQAWKQAAPLIVPDVNQFPGHIACSSLSQSEIVIPLIDHNHVIAVLDIDSEQLNAFDEVDQKYLETIVQYLLQ
ncbi:MAG: GAF domain-containing protein [Microbacter sp.]